MIKIIKPLISSFLMLALVQPVHALRPESSQTTSTITKQDITKKRTWIQQCVPELDGKVMVTVSMEGHIPELPEGIREVMIKGGLGGYQGDKYEGMAKIGMLGFGAQPFYSSRIRQIIQYHPDGTPYQKIVNETCVTPEVIEGLIADGILERVVDPEGKEPFFIVSAWDETDPQNPYKNIPYRVRVFKILRAGIPVYLFYCPEVLDILYTDKSKIHRFTQEVVFTRALAQFKIWCIKNGYNACGTGPLKQVDIVHINEAHPVNTVARIRGYREFDQVAVLYTNHTIVAAGLERFHEADLWADRGRILYQLGINGDTAGDITPVFTREHGWINFYQAAMELCDACNAVSGEHAKHTQRLLSGHKREVIPILNGSGDFWVLDEILKLEQHMKEQNMGEFLDPDNPDHLEIARRYHNIGRNRAFQIIEARIEQMLGRKVRLDMGKPTVWLARRMVEYKNQYPMLRDIIHVLCADRGAIVRTKWGEARGLGMQVVVSGIAPAMSDTECWVSEFIKWMDSPQLEGRFFYVPDCDTEILRAQATGADICVNCPEKDQEACGTSDQRSARNFGVNIVTRSGGPPEIYTEINEETGEGSAFFLKPVTSTGSGPWRDCGGSPIELLEKLAMASRVYYTFTTSGGKDARWLKIMVNSFNASRRVTAEAMEQRYASNVYPAAIRHRAGTLAEKEELTPSIKRQPSGEFDSAA